MKSAYYHRLASSLRSLQASLPAGMQSDEISAVEAAFSQLQSWISTQLSEIAYDDPRNPGL